MTIAATDLSAIARAAYDAYVTKDRGALEALIANDFRFTSPLDNGLDRERYFEICWPNSANIQGFDILHMIEHGDNVFVTYEGRSGQKRFRNTEIMTVRGGKVVAVEVYFGWSIPHEIPAGEHRDPE
jgi:ketosteroid isomerase-like protein